MSNSNRTYRRFVRRVALLVAAALIAVPAAQAADSGGSSSGCVEVGPSVVCRNLLPQPASDPSAAGPGPGVGPVIDTGSVPSPPDQSALPTGNRGTAPVPSADSFDWADAGIGAAIGLGVALLAAWVLLVARRRGGLAGA